MTNLQPTNYNNNWVFHKEPSKEVIQCVSAIQLKKAKAGESSKKDSTSNPVTMSAIPCVEESGYKMPCFYPVTVYRRLLGPLPNGKWPIVFDINNGRGDMPLQVPCGKCLGCRLEKSRMWSVRVMHEASLHKDNMFLTLTYEKMPENNSLNKEDITLFLKRMRDRIGPFRYLQCGEYGEKLGRPHHHAAIFGYRFPDCKKLPGTDLFSSDIAVDIWKKGFVSIGDLTSDSATYICKYVMKRVTGKKEKQHYDGKKPEFVTMSRRPGLGKEWFNKYQKDVINADACVFENGIQARPGRYYDSIRENLDPKEIAKAKQIRQEKKIELTEQQLETKHRALKLKLKQYKRRYEYGTSSLSDT
ncbi:MAG: replication initiator protein [Arizlama microvirus]|nr:MAG: replication initiator protein [Arizlama microvirus]